MLNIENLHAHIKGQSILKGVNLKVKKGEVHAIMGPNGSGKSSLSRLIAGHPAYEVSQGGVQYEVNLKNRDLLQMEAVERALEGIFLGYQYPVELPGVSNFQFLQAAFAAVCKHQGAVVMSETSFRQMVLAKMQELQIDSSFLDRSVNESFSGGEKKRNEILQMSILSPRLAILDETDSGLDIDSLKIVADGINRFRSNDHAIVLITHYQRLLDYVAPDFVHVFADGRIVETGNKDLALELEKKGYAWITQ